MWLCIGVVYNIGVSDTGNGTTVTDSREDRGLSTRAHLDSETNPKGQMMLRAKPPAEIKLGTCQTYCLASKHSFNREGWETLGGAERPRFMTIWERGLDL